MATRLSHRPATGRQTHGGVRRGSTSIVPHVGGGARRISCSERRIRTGYEPRVLLAVVHQQPRQDGAQVCSCAAGEISPRGRRTPTASVGRGTLAWTATCGSVPATGGTTHTGSRGSTPLPGEGLPRDQPFAPPQSLPPPPHTHRMCGTQSHVGTARWWPRLRGGPWGRRMNTVLRSKARRHPPPPMPMDLPCQCPPPLSKDEIWPPLLMELPSRKKKHAHPLRFFHRIAHKLPFFA